MSVSSGRVLSTTLLPDGQLPTLDTGLCAVHIAIHVVDTR